MADPALDGIARVDSSEPLSMDKYTRNARLYSTLLRLGLFVEPRYVNDDRTRIDHFTVSAGLPDDKTY
jgi:hypothetical protein